MEHTILYIHGMGGGGDSRIPSILKERVNRLSPEGRRVNVVVRTYDFNPDKGREQIRSWLDELKPSLVIGESMGSIHTLAIKGLPHILVSPSLGAPLYFKAMSYTTFIPGLTPLYNRIWHPKEGDRQALIFDYAHLKNWNKARRLAIEASPMKGNKDYFFAFFGHHDHYRKSGVVNVRMWKKYYGQDSYAMYDGTHFMEEEYIDSMLIPKIHEVLAGLENNS